MSWLIAKCVDSSIHVLKDLSVERYYKTAGSALQLLDEAATVAVTTTELIHLQNTYWRTLVRATYSILLLHA